MEVSLNRVMFTEIFANKIYKQYSDDDSLSPMKDEFVVAYELPHETTDKTAITIDVCAASEGGSSGYAYSYEGLSPAGLPIRTNVSKTDTYLDFVTRSKFVSTYVVSSSLENIREHRSGYACIFPITAINV